MKEQEPYEERVGWINNHTGNFRVKISTETYDLTEIPGSESKMKNDALLGLSSDRISCDEGKKSTRNLCSFLYLSCWMDDDFSKSSLKHVETFLVSLFL